MAPGAGDLVRRGSDPVAMLGMVLVLALVAAAAVGIVLIRTFGGLTW